MPSFHAYSTEHLQQALACRRRELEQGTPRQQREAVRAIRWLEAELEKRRSHD